MLHEFIIEITIFDNCVESMYETPRSHNLHVKQTAPGGYLGLMITGTDTGKKGTIHQLTTMLSTSENVLFPGHNHLLTPNAYNPSLTGARVIIKESSHQHRWLAGGYDLEI